MHHFCYYIKFGKYWKVGKLFLIICRKGEKKTIKEFGFVLKRVTEEVKADPRHRVDAFHEYLEQQNAKVNGKGTKMSFGEL